MIKFFKGNNKTERDKIIGISKFDFLIIFLN